MDKFIVGEGYSINYSNGSINLKCVARTEKTVTFEYEDGERIKKRIKQATTNLKDYFEFVVINGMNVIA